MVRKGFKSRSGKTISKRAFTKGFAKKSFLGSAFPSLRSVAPTMDRKFSTRLESQFKEIDAQSKKSLNTFSVRRA